MLDACYEKKVAIYVKQFVIKVAKCKQRSILTSIQNTYSKMFYEETSLD
jgi:hypothetical protein